MIFSICEFIIGLQFTKRESGDLMIGQRIKSIRQSKGITQVHLAKELGYSHSSALSEIESGKKRLSADKIPIAAKVLGVSIEELFFDEKVLVSRTS